MNDKKKLMVVIGAGASVELGMPSVTDIDRLFHNWALKEFTLANNDSLSLYGYVRDKTNCHYSHNPRAGLAKRTNFEEVLYTIFQLSSILSDDNFYFPMNAFLGLRELPKIKSSRGEKTIDGDDFRHLGFLLVDNLIKDFRTRCIEVQSKKASEFTDFKHFMCRLGQNYEVAFISINCDNLVTQACPNLFTGFDPTTGSFDSESIYNRTNWDLIYHLHGSVHFDMQGEGLDMHAIKWNADLTAKFHQNSFGRNSQRTMENIDMPTSVIVTGYGKTNQIQRLPFRTYYSQIDEIVEKAEAILFLGYGFQDLHLNNCFHSIRKGPRPRPLVVIDRALDNEDPMKFRFDPWSNNLRKTIPVNSSEMATKKFRHVPPYIAKLKRNNEFEVSTNPLYPLSIWHGGFINACKHYNKIKDELDQ